MNDDPLKLRQLPPLEPPSGLWSAIEQQLLKPGRARWRVWAPAVTATLAVGLALGVLMQTPAPDPGGGPAPIGTTSIQTTPIQAAMAQSADLEAELRAREQGSVSTRMLASVLLLEVELDWLDLRLAERPQDLQLWQQRSELLAMLILRYAEPVELALGSAELF